jgi:hypothetical protein
VVTAVDRVWIVETGSARLVFGTQADARRYVEGWRAGGRELYLLGEYALVKPRKRKRKAGKRGGR